MVTVADVCGGDSQDGHGEMVREAQKPVHYDYKNRLGGMMRKISWVFLLLSFLASAESGLC